MLLLLRTKPSHFPLGKRQAGSEVSVWPRAVRAPVPCPTGVPCSSPLAAGPGNPDELKWVQRARRDTAVPEDHTWPRSTRLVGTVQSRRREGPASPQSRRGGRPSPSPSELRRPSVRSWALPGVCPS